MRWCGNSISGQGMVLGNLNFPCHAAKSSFSVSFFQWHPVY
jgi:hypothetical protein